MVIQLIDTRTDQHLWTETYDPEESDIFAIQSEIAQDVARALEAELTPGELAQLEASSPVSGEAYEKYAEGIFQWDLRETRGNALQAVELFQEATELDPDFALAHAALSQARMWVFWNFPGAQDQAELAREALDRAIALAPNAVETRLAQGYFYFYGRGDSQEALRLFNEAQALKPSDANVIIAIGLILRGQGRWEEALAAFERARTYDYRSYNLIYTLAETAFRMRRYDQAQRYYELAATLAPEVMTAHSDLLRTRMARTGDLSAAQAYVDDLPPSTAPQIRASLRSELAYYRGDFQAALSQRPGGGGALRSAGVQGPMARNHERLALLYHLMGEESLCAAHADSLRMTSEATLDAATADRRGAVQSGVIARAHAKLGIAYALLGETISAVAEGSKAVSTLPITVDAYDGGDHLRDLILIYTLIGAPDLAMEELVTALSNPSPLTRVDLLLDPVFEPLRQHPDFAGLLRSVQ